MKRETQPTSWALSPLALGARTYWSLPEVHDLFSPLHTHYHKDTVISSLMNISAASSKVSLPLLLTLQVHPPMEAREGPQDPGLAVHSLPKAVSGSSPL